MSALSLIRVVRVIRVIRVIRVMRVIRVRVSKTASLLGLFYMAIRAVVICTYQSCTLECPSCTAHTHTNPTRVEHRPLQVH